MVVASLILPRGRRVRSRRGQSSGRRHGDSVMVAPVLRESAFVWTCVALMGGCAFAAFVVQQRMFLLGISEQFIRLPPSGKAVLAAAVVVATVFAQKPANVTTDSHGLAQIEEVVSATPTEESAYPPAKQPEGASRRGALNTEGFEEWRHGEGEEWRATNQHEFARISIRDYSCQFVDKAPVDSEESPCLPTSNNSRPLARPSGSPSAKVPSETPCVSSAHVFSVADTLPVSSRRFRGAQETCLTSARGAVLLWYTVFTYQDI